MHFLVRLVTTKEKQFYSTNKEIALKQHKGKNYVK